MPDLPDASRDAMRPADPVVGQSVPSERGSRRPLPIDRDLLLDIRVETKRFIAWAIQITDAFRQLLEVLRPDGSERLQVVTTSVGSMVLSKFEESRAEPPPNIDLDLLEYIYVSDEEVENLRQYHCILSRCSLSLAGVDLRGGFSKSALWESHWLAWTANCLLGHFRRLDSDVCQKIDSLAGLHIQSGKPRRSEPGQEGSPSAKQSASAPAIRVEAVGDSNLVYVGDQCLGAVDDQAAAFVRALVELGPDYVPFREMASSYPDLEGGNQTRIWKKKLPAGLRDLIETDKGKGFRIKRSRQRV